MASILSPTFNHWPVEHELTASNESYRAELKNKGLKEAAAVVEQLLPPTFVVSIGGSGPLWCS